MMFIGGCSVLNTLYLIHSISFNLFTRLYKVKKKKKNLKWFLFAKVHKVNRKGSKYLKLSLALRLEGKSLNTHIRTIDFISLQHAASPTPSLICNDRDCYFDLWHFHFKLQAFCFLSAFSFLSLFSIHVHTLPCWRHTQFNSIITPRIEIFSLFLSTELDAI